jgi:hypothetical protein
MKKKAENSGKKLKGFRRRVFLINKASKSKSKGFPENKKFRKSKNIFYFFRFFSKVVFRKSKISGKGECFRRRVFFINKASKSKSKGFR